MSDAQTKKELSANPTAFQGAGGTPGGVGLFLVGIGMIVAGAYLILNHIVVHTRVSVWGWPGVDGGGFGPLLIAMMVGVGILFFNSKNALGWLLTAGAALTMFVSVIMNLELFFRPVSLLTTIVMFGLVAAGLGVVFRSFRAAPED